MSMQMMDNHARTLDDALADLKRSLAARPGDTSSEAGPPRGPRRDFGKGLGASSRGGSNGRDSHGSNAAKARYHLPVAGSNLPARSAFKVDPLTIIMVVLGIIVGFQQVTARIDRVHNNPTMIKLVFPSAEGLRDSRL